MKLLLYRIAVVLALVLLGQGELGACDGAEIRGPDKICAGKSGTYTGFALKEPGCGVNTTQTIEIMSAPAGANPIITAANDIGNDVSIKFDMVGTYEILYTFLDEEDCNVAPCSKPITTEVILPEASFEESRLEICYGSILEADINFVNASSASVRNQTGSINRSVDVGEGGVGTYVSQNVVLESFTLFITNAVEKSINCPQMKMFDSLQVVVLDAPALELLEVDCNATNTEYSAVYRITGGDGTYTLETPEMGVIEGDRFISNFRPENEPFTFTINTGPTCGSFTATEMHECTCTANAGMMQDTAVAACASDTITVNHDITDLDKRSSDSIIYVLHNSDQNDLGEIFATSYKPNFTLPRAELADSNLYISAVVGPLTIENFNYEEISCKDISFGTPIRWFSSDEFSINGKLDVCANEKNRMYTLVPKEGKPLKRPSVQSWEIGEGSGAFIESQNSERIFLSFPSATSTSTIYYHSDFMPNPNKTCRSTDTLEITVDGSVSAPEPGEIILWPGNIMASTSQGPCYQWGFVTKNSEQFTFNRFEGQNEKYFFSPDDIRVGLSIFDDRAYYVAIYDTPDCDFDLLNCNSITFFNQNLIPGLKVSDEDDFSLNIAPNPNDGTFRLELEGSYQGEYQVDVVSDIGQRVQHQVVEKRYNRSITDMNLGDLSVGLYFIIITNEFGKREIIKTVIAR